MRKIVGLRGISTALVQAHWKQTGWLDMIGMKLGSGSVCGQEAEGGGWELCS